MKQVETNIGTSQRALQRLQAAVAANPAGVRQPKLGSENVAAAQTAARKLLADSASALEAAGAQAADFDQRAAELVQSARSFVSGLRCS